MCQVHNIIAVVGIRCIVALALCSGLLSCAFLYNPMTFNLGAAILIAGLCPISMQVQNEVCYGFFCIDYLLGSGL